MSLLSQGTLLSRHDGLLGHGRISSEEYGPFNAAMMRDSGPSVNGGVEASELTVGARLGRGHAHASWALLQTEAVVLISIRATAPGRLLS